MLRNMFGMNAPTRHDPHHSRFYNGLLRLLILHNEPIGYGEFDLQVALDLKQRIVDLHVGSPQDSAQ